MHIENIEQLNQWREKCRTEFKAQKRRILICLGTACRANGAVEVYEEFKNVLADKKITDVSVEAVTKTGCHGYCALGPLVIIEPERTFYTRVKKTHIPEIIERTLENGEIIAGLL